MRLLVAHIFHARRWRVYIPVPYYGGQDAESALSTVVSNLRITQVAYLTPR
jgi:hypothetical protein